MKKTGKAEKSVNQDQQVHQEIIFFEQAALHTQGLSGKNLEFYTRTTCEGD